jgi:hypothetical protein
MYIMLGRVLPVLLASCAFAQHCDLSGYRIQAGPRAEQRAGTLQITWNGERGSELRASFTIRSGTPVISELAGRSRGGAWKTLGRDLKPEFEVTSGRRRLSEQQMAPLRKLGVAITPELVEREQWNAFWDAPLSVPGIKGTNLDLPRKPEEIRRATASYSASSCSVKSDGARLEIEYPGLSMGIFSGSLRFTVYQGSNLLRQEAIAKTDEKAVAYKYDAGLRGFSTESARVIWRDVARAWQDYEFGGSVNKDRVALRARNRLALIEYSSGGTLAVFPPPHKFFWAREIELNLGYVWYRKDDDRSFSAGVRQAEREEMYRPYGISDEVWKRREEQSRHFTANFALYNAPPGTWQRMPVYYYLSADSAQPTADAVLAYTHNDRFAPLSGYQVTVSHFHTHFHELLEDAGTIDVQPAWVPTFKELGINIAMMSDFHSDGHGGDPGPVRFAEQKTYFDGCRRFSDKSLLILPGEEPDAFFGGHYTMMLPRPVFWSKVKKTGQSFEENDPAYGKVYHVGSKDEEFRMLQQEHGLMWQSHPRTKGSAGYPDAIREEPYFRSDRFLGGSFQSLPVDLSEQRLCEGRCLKLFDDMNNWAGPKFMIAEGDTYQKFPEDETYPHIYVNYVKLDTLPRFDDDWSPILKSMRAGDFFVTSGEILIRSSRVEGKTFIADLSWTFPLEFVEIVWGDGDKTGRQVLSATGSAPHGSHTFRVPFDPAGKKWVRFAAWDSAGNGALTQPVHLR